MSNHTIGTSHFVSRAAAIAYYRDYGDGPTEVDAKIKAGDIAIGPPKLEPGETLGTTDSGRRYTIVTAA